MTDRCRRLVMTSHTYLKDSAIENLDILRDGDRNNRRDGVASVLIKRGDRFFQVMEGPADMVGAALERMLEDRRHYDVTVLNDRPDATPRLGAPGLNYVQRPSDDPGSDLEEVARIDPEAALETATIH
ncbi:BLUF domain-containing protein [Roseivivax sediminis]|uniref:Sensors of blue-light using FAD n=1 Tax=Roseivivax sediminis TaxID=936889 RepID=A0A1I2B0M3_9RHOB|nr:BLUF domain-containing protein [Roseivivax sediminis]SFE49741.1 Sensors of blue-light using FAD [Roseivivax sediminis]